MSQVLGKPQPEEEDDEEDELVGLADYGDGPDSSDAEPDSGAEEGGERRVPGSAPAGRISAGTPAGPGARAADLEGIQESGVSRLRSGGAPEELVASCKMGEPGCRQWAGGPGSVGEGKEEAFDWRNALGQFRALRRVWGLGSGAGPPGALGSSP